MKQILPLILTCLIFAGCLSPGDARARGYDQGVSGQAYSRILGRNVDEHRQGWVEGNAQYCQTLSYADLARSLGQMPTGICQFSDANLRAYCQNVDYAAFGRADQDLPSICIPNASARETFSSARITTYCTASYGRSDLRRTADSLWSRGSCAPGSGRRSCERSRRLADAARPYCQGSYAYEAGAQNVIVQAQSEAIHYAADELADLSAILNPPPQDQERRAALREYLDWAPECELERDLSLDC